MKKGFQTILMIFLVFILVSCRPFSPEGDLETEQVGITPASITPVSGNQTSTPTGLVIPTTTSTPVSTKTTEPSPTATDNKVYLSFTDQVNCRTGPGTNYQTLSSVQQGSAVRVLGKNATGEWFYVQAPNGIIGGCWVSSFGFNSASISVPVINTISAPEQTRMPTSVSDTRIKLTYIGYGMCNGGVAPKFHLSNKGTLAIKTLTIRNVDYSVDPIREGIFRSSKFNLSPDQSASFSTCDEDSHFPYDISGHQMSAELTACLTDGSCFSQVFFFNP